MRYLAIAMLLALLGACGGKDDDKGNDGKRDKKSRRADDDDDDRAERRKKRDRDRSDDTDALERYGEEQAALAKAKEEARKAALEANKAADAARAQVDLLAKDVDEMDKRVNAAVDAAASAATREERDAAVAALKRLQVEKAELQRRIAEARAAAARSERLRGSTVSKECQENPLAKGCM